MAYACLINNTTIQQGGNNHICATRRHATNQGILFGLQIQDRVSLFEPDFKSGCQICTITPNQDPYPQCFLAPIGFNLFFLKDNLLHVTMIGCHHGQRITHVLVANRNKRLVASYPGTFVLAQDLHEENCRLF